MKNWLIIFMFLVLVCCQGQEEELDSSSGTHLGGAQGGGTRSKSYESLK